MVFGMNPGDKYYDGPIIPSGKTIEELDEEFEKEKERNKDIKWTPEMLKE